MNDDFVSLDDWRQQKSNISASGLSWEFSFAYVHVHRPIEGTVELSSFQAKILHSLDLIVLWPKFVLPWGFHSGSPSCLVGPVTASARQPRLARTVWRRFQNSQLKAQRNLILFNWNYLLSPDNWLFWKSKVQ